MRGSTWDVTTIQVNINYKVHDFDRKFVEKSE